MKRPRQQQGKLRGALRAAIKQKFTNVNQWEAEARRLGYIPPTSVRKLLRGASDIFWYVDTLLVLGEIFGQMGITQRDGEIMPRDYFLRCLVGDYVSEQEEPLEEAADFLQQAATMGSIQEKIRLLSMEERVEMSSWLFRHLSHETKKAA